jgi:hypothetical protein
LLHDPHRIGYRIAQFLVALAAPVFIRRAEFVSEKGRLIADGAVVHNSDKLE